MNNEHILKHSSSYQERLLQDLRDKDEAIAYLKVALEEYEHDHDAEAFMMALRNVAEAYGGIKNLAAKAHINREDLYRALSKKSSPRLITLDIILRSLGFKLSIETI